MNYISGRPDHNKLVKININSISTHFPATRRFYENIDNCIDQCIVSELQIMKYIWWFHSLGMGHFTLF